jgi:glutathione S-transferase
MKLRYSPTSPYARKVAATLIELGLDDRVEQVATNPWDPASGIAGDNPLGKVPALILDDGSSLFDSPVICEYLDRVHGSGILLPDDDRRWDMLRQQALADGIMDAAILLFLETGKREEPHRSEWWMNLQRQAIEQSLLALEQMAPDLGQGVNLGLIAIGCALGYLDLRFDDMNWRGQAPSLADWYDTFSRRESMLKTTPRIPK